MQMNMGSSDNSRLLLLSADETWRATHCAAFQGHFGPSLMIAEAVNGQEGARKLREGGFDMIVAELSSLRDISSDTEIAVGRLARLCPNALIVVLLADHSVSAAMAAMRAGAQDYVSRSACADEVIAQMESLLHRHGKMGAAATVVQTPEFAMRGMPAIPREILPLWQHEQRIIEETIAYFGGNIAQAAAALQISPSTIYRKRQCWEDNTPLIAGAA